MALCLQAGRKKYPVDPVAMHPFSVPEAHKLNAK
jgi:hypothetical protein